jgi:hypothetical protein
MYDEASVVAVCSGAGAAEREGEDHDEQVRGGRISQAPLRLPGNKFQGSTLFFCSCFQDIKKT